MTPTTGPLRTSFREALSPADRLGRAALALAVLRAPVVWLAAWLGRGEPLSVTAMYRPGGDVQYFELAGALARGNLGESNVLEAAGKGLHPFPLGSIWLHSALFAAAGPAGLLIADAVATVAGYVALFALARACRLSTRAAAAFGAFVCGYVYVVAAPLTDRLGWGRDLIWGDRFPRPLLTEIYVLLTLTVLVRLWLERRDAGAGPRTEPGPGRGFWVFAGVVYTLLLQSDVYSAFICGLLYVIVLGRRLLSRPEARRGTLLGAGIVALVVGATAWPFALQRAGTTPELLVRWGTYPISRLTALSWARFIPLGGPALVAIAAAVVLWLLRRRGEAQNTASESAAAGSAVARTAHEAPRGGGAEADSPATEKRAAGSAAAKDAVARTAHEAPRGGGAEALEGPDARVVWFFCLVTAVTALAFPLFFVILGKALYPYMFPDRLRRAAALACTVIGMVGVAAVWPAAAKRRWAGTAAAVALMLAAAGGVGARARENLRREEHPRKGWYDLKGTGSYRKAFTELVRELERPVYSNAMVLATVDQMVHVHWQAFSGKCSFLPDAFVSIAPDAELERRFVLFARTLGMSPDELSSFAQADGFNVLFLGLSKYATNRFHTFAPLEEYTEEQRRRILARDVFNAFHTDMPAGELARLREELTGPAFRDDPPRLDLIVLHNDARFKDLAPPAAEHELTFQNAVFRLYARKDVLAR